MIVWIYDRWGAQTGNIKDVIEFVHDDEIGALDFIEFQAIGEPLQKDDYLVWRDDFGVWHEHIVRSATVVHGNGGIRQQIYAVNSVAELTRSYINEVNVYGFKNSVAWQRLLQDTRWTTGTINDLGLGQVKFYHQTIYEGVTDIVDKWGGEISTTITVTANGVAERRINHEAKRGQDNGLLFTYGFDMGNIERKVELDDVYTKIHVFGKGEAIYNDEGEQTGNGRRIDFADINSGKDYLEDNEALKKYGIIGKDNQRQHAEGVVIFEECEDPEELLALGKAELEVLKQPRVTYTADVALLAEAGMSFKNARAGDTCYIRDKELDERLNGRITHVRRFYGSATPTEITIGNIKRTVKDIFSEQMRALQDLQDRSPYWDDASSANSGWLDYMMDNLNDFMNAVGGFVYWQQGEGLTVYDRPIDQNPTMAIQLNGAGFRIANEKKSDGTWNWRTFGTGDGFTADLINVGILRCGDNIINLNTGTITLKDGSIQDLNGRNFWNLATGELQIRDENDKGIHYKDGKLTIDANTVIIGAQNIEDWTNSQIKVEAGNITSTVTQLRKDMEDADAALGENLGNAVTQLESSIEQTATSITSRVSEVATSVKNLDGKVDDNYRDLNGSITSAVSSLESTIEQTARSIKSTVKDEYTQYVGEQIGKVESKISSVEQTATNITSKVSEVEKNVKTLDGKVDDKYNELSGSIASTASTLESTIEQTATNIKTTVKDEYTAYFDNGISNVETKISAVEQTASNIKSTVAEIENDVANKYTEITQETNSLSLAIQDVEKRTVCTFKCTTGASTQDKIATKDPAEQVFERTTGTVIAVTFTNSNTAAKPTLTVGSTAKANILGITTQTTWSAGATLLFTWTGSAWQMTDSVAQNYINAHFLANTDGLTIMSSASSYKSRMRAGDYQILDAKDNEILTISATKDANQDASIEFYTRDFGEMAFITAMSSFSFSESGFRFDSTFPGFSVNYCASVEVDRGIPESTTASTQVYVRNRGTLEAVDIYYTARNANIDPAASGKGECRIIRVNFKGKTTTAYATLTHHYHPDQLNSDGNVISDAAGYIVFEKIALTKDPDSSRIFITRTQAWRGYITNGSTSSTQNAGTQFDINYIATCLAPY